MRSQPFRTAAELPSSTGTCDRCGAQIERGDLVSAIDGSSRCRTCEMPLAPLVPPARDTVPVGAQVAIIGFLVFVFGWLLPLAC